MTKYLFSIDVAYYFNLQLIFLCNLLIVAIKYKIIDCKTSMEIDMTEAVQQLSTVLGSTRINNVNVTTTVTIQASYVAIIASNDSYIGVWNGFEAVGTPIVKVPATSTSGTVTLQAQGYNFNEGPYTIGFIVNVNSSNSIAATSIIVNGQYLKSETTTLFVTNQRNYDGKSVLTVNYSTPEGNKPQSNLDWIYLFAGAGVKSPTQPSIIHWNVTSNQSSGTLTLTTGSPLTYGAEYTLEYNPGSSTTAISAFYSFTFTGQ
jgi:hypothetical protein